MEEPAGTVDGADETARERIIVLTGVTRGLGRALLDRFDEGQHRVVGCGRDEAAVRDLRKQFSGRHDFSVVDVAEDEAVGAWAIAVLERVGTPDLLINNAAVMNTPADLWQVSASEFSALIDVNIKGTASVVRHFVPAMISTPRALGVIVNFSSGWGRSTSSGVAPYCASKWAIEGMTAALAQELPRGMATVALNPGIIDTDMLRIAFGEGPSASYEGPEEWSFRAAPRLLAIGAQDNGRPLTV